ncbi:MAG: hypothetical protein AAFY28_07335 [Actinomycetota bacterium]
MTNEPESTDRPTDRPTSGGRWAPLAAALVTVTIVAAATAVASDPPRSIESADADVRVASSTRAGSADASTAASTAATTTIAQREPATTSRSVPSATSTSTPPAEAVVDEPAIEPTSAADAPVPDVDNPAVVARPAPPDAPPPPPPDAPPPPWAASTGFSEAGYVSVDVGCATGTDGAALDAFFAQRVGPVLGWDYQHVYPLGGDRYLWVFQDTFVEHSGTATTLDRSGFVHNAALVQEGSCFQLLHRGSIFRPEPFEVGTGTRTLSTWFWPMGGELHGGQLHIVWAEMVKDAVDPTPPDGLGWHPRRTWIGTYDPTTLARTGFAPAPNAGTVPIYGYAVASDATHTYLFGNTFEQNLLREGGYWNGPHSATEVYLARVPRGQLFAAPMYKSTSGWSSDPRDAAPILQRQWVEFPFQPRFMDGQWVAVSADDGYWGDALTVDVANDPWGPWTTVASGPLVPRNADPLMNTYHAHLAPWRDGAGNLVVTVSNNARNMLAHAWPRPDRYRPMAFSWPWVPAPPRPEPVPPPTTAAPTTTAAPSTTAPPTTVATTTTTTPPTTTTTPSTTTSTTSTTTTSTTTTTTTTTTTAPTSAPSSEPDGSDESDAADESDVSGAVEHSAEDP